MRQQHTCRSENINKQYILTGQCKTFIQYEIQMGTHTALSEGHLTPEGGIVECMRRENYSEISTGEGSRTTRVNMVLEEYMETWSGK